MHTNLWKESPLLVKDKPPKSKQSQTVLSMNNEMPQVDTAKASTTVRTSLKGRQLNYWIHSTFTKLLRRSQRRQQLTQFAKSQTIASIDWWPINLSLFDLRDKGRKNSSTLFISNDLSLPVHQIKTKNGNKFVAKSSWNQYRRKTKAHLKEQDKSYAILWPKWRERTTCMHIEEGSMVQRDSVAIRQGQIT